VNLRLATATEQRRNLSLHRNKSSGLIGVRWYPRNRAWGARARRAAEVFLGLFPRAEDAALAGSW
jgi:hypothetical protein